MSSTGANQVSTSYASKRHGMFTYWWLKGIGGEADADANRKITVGEMKEYLADAVPYWAGRISNQEQTPVIVGEDTRVLAHLAPR